MAEPFDDVAKYFEAGKWNETSNYEKIRFQNMYNNYKEMIESGFDAPKPYFMDDIKEEEKSGLDGMVENERKFKQKCVSVHELRKRSKIEKDTSTRYPKRNLPARSCVEVGEISEDRYVYCDECMYEYLNTCEEHTLIQINDNPVPANKNPDRARETVPKGWMEVKESKLKDGGDGIWALRKIPKGIKFGPFEGKVETDHRSGRYCWQIKRDGRAIKCIDGSDTSVANWMRYVNCARNREEQNLMAYQYFGNIFYRSVVDIEPHTELLVHYGAKFTKELGIDVSNKNTPQSDLFPKKSFKCDNCYLLFCSLMYLEEHVGRCTRKEVASENDERNVVETNVSTASDELFECKPCSVTYTIKSYYDKHMKSKHRVCKNPDSGLDSSLSISSVATIYGEKEFVKNSASDSGNRRFNCTYCAKTFTRNSSLKRHICVHTGVGTYACTVCNKQFTQRSDLQRHERIHIGKSPYAHFTDRSSKKTNC